MNPHRRCLTSKEFREEIKLLAKEAQDKLKAKEEMKTKKRDIAQQKKDEKIQLQVDKKKEKELVKEKSSKYGCLVVQHVRKRILFITPLVKSLRI